MGMGTVNLIIKSYGSKKIANVKKGMDIEM